MRYREFQNIEREMELKLVTLQVDTIVGSMEHNTLEMAIQEKIEEEREEKRRRESEQEEEEEEEEEQEQEQEQEQERDNYDNVL